MSIRQSEHFKQWHGGENKEGQHKNNEKSNLVGAQCLK